MEIIFAIVALACVAGCVGLAAAAGALGAKARDTTREKSPSRTADPPGE